MPKTLPVTQDGHALIEAIQHGYDAYLAYTQHLLKAHNENFARLLDDAKAVNPWLPGKANEALGEWMNLCVTNMESTVDWMRRVQERARSAPYERRAQ